MKKLGQWALRTVSAAVVIALLIVLLPRISALVAAWWPDPAKTRRVEAVISSELAASERLETAALSQERVAVHTVDALLLGEVQRVTLRYRYDASIGLDLREAVCRAEGGVLTLSLPPLTILHDSLTPLETEVQDFSYALTEKRRQAIWEEERQKCRDAFLADGEAQAKARGDTERAIRGLLEKWMDAGEGRVPLRIVWNETPTSPEGT